MNQTLDPTRLLDPDELAECVLSQALSQLSARGRVRLALDWTTEDTQHLLVISLVVGRRATPIYWRAYDQSVLKGRMRRGPGSASLCSAFATSV